MFLSEDSLVLDGIRSLHEAVKNGVIARPLYLGREEDALQLHSRHTMETTFPADCRSYGEQLVVLCAAYSAPGP